jgi:hypothetical protein|nr:MAG TPA: homing endonuclease [Caudoviricetes sp.]
MQEIWKDIEGYEGLYQVSNFGRVKSLDRYVLRNENTLFVKGIVLSQLNNRGYLTVRLCNSGKYKNYLVHKLVANAFIHNDNNYSEINHIDENKHNNYVDNLEWCDRKYNVNYGSRADKFSNSMKGKLAGKNNPRYGKIGTMNGKHLTAEQKNKISAQALGRIWVHKDKETKRIMKRELDKYIIDGYSLGRI